jgi:hypothetical protein
LEQALRTEAHGGVIRASGICHDGWIVQGGEKRSAVIVHLEHVCGAGAKACIPYTKKTHTGLDLGEVSVAPDKPKVFARG